jgi:hypothetical protein
MEPGSRAVLEPPDSLASFTVGPPDSLAQPIETMDAMPQRTNGTRRKTLEPTRPSSTEEAPPKSTEVLTEPPSVSVALPEEQRLQLRTAALGDITQTKTILSGLKPNALTDKERQTVDAITGLVEQALGALLQDDTQAAADLAHKARLLADKFSRPAPR